VCDGCAHRSEEATAHARCGARRTSRWPSIALGVVAATWHQLCPPAPSGLIPAQPLNDPQPPARLHDRNAITRANAPPSRPCLVSGVESKQRSAPPTPASVFHIKPLAHKSHSFPFLMFLLPFCPTCPASAPYSIQQLSPRIQARTLQRSVVFLLCFPSPLLRRRISQSILLHCLLYLDILLRCQKLDCTRICHWRPLTRMTFRSREDCLAARYYFRPFSALVLLLL
jgi:hypothetical protein